MANLSKIKRDRMMEFLQTLKAKHNDDESIRAFSEIENFLREKKYGLVWEEHTEHVDDMLQQNIPVFCEDKEHKIVSDVNLPYNFLLEGDNLQSLYLLEKTHKGMIDVIYIDPPYNRGKDDFIYDDNFIDKNDSFRHSKWLSFMNERLRIAYNLLSESGVMFLSIDENEFAQAKMLCDEIFTEECFMECIIWNKRVPKNDKGIGNIHEYILLYVKSVNENKHKFMMPKDGLDEIFDFVDTLKKRKVPIDEAEEMLKTFYNRKGYDRAITLYCQLDKNYDIFGKINMCWPNGNSYGPVYEVIHPILKKPVQVPSRGWRWNEKTFYQIAGYNPGTHEYTDMEERYDGSVICKGNDKRNGIWFSNKLSVQPSSIKYLRDLDRMLFRSIYSTKSDGSLALENIIDEKNIFSYPKPPKLVYDLLDSVLYNKKSAIVLDFFAGSGTTGEAVLQLNAYNNTQHRFILCTNNELSIFQKLKYIHDSGYLQEYNPNKTVNPKTVENKIKTFFKDKQDLYNQLFEENTEWEKYGICQYVTYPRLKTIITGIKENGSSYSDGIPANLKYFKCGWIDRKPENYMLSNVLCLHIKEMIELQNAIEIDNIKNVLLLNKDDIRNTIFNPDIYNKIENIWLNQNIILNSTELDLLNDKGYKYIPNEFFGKELKEVAE